MARTTKAKPSSEPPASIPGMFVPTGQNESEEQEENEGQTEEERAAEDTLAIAAEQSPREPYATIKVRRPDSPEFRYLDKVSAQQVNESWLASTYGGGSFQVTYYKPGKGRGGRPGSRMVYDTQRSFEVDPNVPPRVPAWLRNNSAAGAPVLEGPVSDGNTRRGDIMDAGLLQLFTMQTTMMERMSKAESSTDKLLPIIMQMAQPKPAMDFAQLLTALAPIAAAFVSSMNTRKDPAEIAAQMIAQMRPAEAPPALDPLETIERVANIIGARTGPAGGVTDMVTMLESMARLREVMGGGAEAADPLTGLLTTLGPKVLEVITAAQQKEAAQANAAATRQAVAVHPAPALPAGEPVAIPSPAPDMPAWLIMVRQFVPRILDLARKGKDPHLYAEVTVDNIPEAYRGLLAEHAQRDTFVDEVMQAVPELAEFDGWARKFLGQIHDMHTDDDGADDDDDDGDGDDMGGDAEAAESLAP